MGFFVVRISGKLERPPCGWDYACKLKRDEGLGLDRTSFRWCPFKEVVMDFS